MIYFKLFLTFFKIGFLGFGGGLAILPMIYQGIEGFYPITESEFADLVAVSQATPGPIAVNAATYTGYQVAGIAGSLCATLGVVLPAFILVVTTLKLISRFKESKAVNGAMIGLRPAALGLVACAMVFIFKGALMFDTAFEGNRLTLALAGLPYGSSINYMGMVITAITVVLSFRYKVSAVKLILIMGAVGIVLFS